MDADVTDEGGETRSASRSFRLGFVSVEARIAEPPEFLLESRPGALTVVRTNLDGVPRAGQGPWRLVALEQPAQSMLPAEPAVAGEPRREASSARRATRFGLAGIPCTGRRR